MAEDTSGSVDFMAREFITVVNEYVMRIIGD